MRTPIETAVYLSREQIAKFFSKYLIEAVPQTSDKEEYRQLAQIRINAWCKKWIPRLYGIHPGEPQWRMACLSEFILLLEPYGIANWHSMRTNWNWEETTEFPLYLVGVLKPYDLIYTLLATVGSLPKRNIRRG